MAAQLKSLANTIALLAKSENPAGENCDPNRGCSHHGPCRGKYRQMTKLHNMGGYCWSHGFHLVGTTHDSKTCNFKKEGHRDDASYSNHLEGSTYWPITHCIAIEQQNHATWKNINKPN